jgi:hypothetical protein
MEESEIQVTRNDDGDTAETEKLSQQKKQIDSCEEMISDDVRCNNYPSLDWFLSPVFFNPNRIKYKN